MKTLRPFSSRTQSQNEIDRKKTKEEVIDISRFLSITYTAFRKSVLRKNADP